MKQTKTAPIETTLEQRLGGKGAKLARLDALGCDVPEWFGIEADAFRAVVAMPVVQEALAAAQALVEAGQIDAAAQAVQHAVRSVELPDDVRESVVARWRALESELVAVRSSAIGEDSAEQSFAGQFDSVLGVKGEQQLVHAVRQCWASAFNARAIAYRAQHGMPALEVAMGVVVQRMVDADVAGVAFTADPITGDPYTLVVSATYGLGEALVSGIANADTYRVDRHTRAVDSDIADKDLQIVLSPGGLTEECDVPAHRRGEAAMTTEQVLALADVALRLEAEEGAPQDIEFALVGERIHILQTRPITSKLRPRGLRRVWDNSNIVESYAGVVSPLTFSFAREAYGAVYLQYARLMRTPKAELPRANVVFRQMLGYLDGRVYYNLRSWYYLLSLLPNYEENKGAMEQMMGVREGINPTLAPPAGVGRRLQVALGTVWNLLTIKRSIRAFRANLFDTLDRYDRDFDAMDADELVDAYDELRLNLLSNWQAPLVNDFRVMVFFNKLKQRIERSGIDVTGTLQNDLLCGQGEVESAEPTYMLMRMAERVRGDARLRSLVLEAPDDALLARVEAYGTDDAQWVLEQFETYLRRFGDRCANELKLETPTLRENPAFVFSVLRNFVRQHDLSEQRLLEQERAIRDRAETIVRNSLAGGPAGAVRTRVFFWQLNQARNAVRDREALRFDRTRVFGLARRILWALGRRLHEAGLVDDAHDVFFLEVDEVIGTVQGTCTTKDVRALVALRKAQHEQWEQHELPDRVETTGVTNANPFDDAYAAVDVSGDSLSGIGCCPGVVERTARVVHSPDQGVELSGDIMVCTRTDPGWVPLFPSCGGLLVERGSLLSHSAIVAREFGIPAIVGIPGLMRWAADKDGEMLRMDGASGVVEAAGDGAAPVAEAGE